MKIKIDDHGCLSIWRESEKGYKSQFCPFSTDIDSDNDECGDWCPLFYIEPSDCGPYMTSKLRLCKAVYDVDIEYESI